MKKTITPEQVDDLLPQTQCGLCGYGGCMPYAEAILYENERLNLCPPGGVNTLRNLGDLLDQDISLFISDMEKMQKPQMLAIIREAECIGCTKCIQVCPVDAIIGAAKQMHSVITDICTGCELCVPPCPVDCIDMMSIPSDDNLKDNNLEDDNLEDDNLEDDNLEDDNLEDDNLEDDNLEDDNLEDDNLEDDNLEDDNLEDHHLNNKRTLNKEKSNQSRQRFQAREKRLAKEKLAKEKTLIKISQKSPSQIQKLNYIEAALARVKAKKM